MSRRNMTEGRASLSSRAFSPVRDVLLLRFRARAAIPRIGDVPPVDPPRVGRPLPEPRTTGRRARRRASSAGSGAIVDELAQPGGEAVGIDEVDEVAVARPLLELHVWKPSE